MTTQFATIKEKKYSPQKLRGFLIENWCLKRSKLIYSLVSRWKQGDVKINIAMRCRDNTYADWGHAWVSYNGTPIMEFKRSLLNRPKVKIAESDKYIYWLYK